MLESAHEHDPNALWWIKGDGVDIVKVSTCGKWSEMLMFAMEFSPHFALSE